MFSIEKYTVVKGVLSNDLLAFCQQYCSFQERRYPKSNFDNPDNKAHWEYADPFMETLLVKLLPTFEQHTELELIPAYSYHRIYKSGDAMAPHKDRAPCEITCSIHLGHDYKGMPDNYEWYLWIENKERNDIPVPLNAGDAVIYRGMEVYHKREVFAVPHAAWHLQVFLSYVEKGGEMDHLKYDKRSGLGYKGAYHPVR